MSRPHDAHLAAQAARAIERVLLAERQAEASLAQARQQVEQELERAREDALAQVNHAMDRMARWQQGHAQAMQHRLALRRAQAAAATVGLLALDEAALDEAVQAVAARLCGGADGGPSAGGLAGPENRHG